MKKKILKKQSKKAKSLSPKTAPKKTSPAGKLVQTPVQDYVWLLMLTAILGLTVSVLSFGN